MAAVLRMFWRTTVITLNHFNTRTQCHNWKVKCTNMLCDWSAILRRALCGTKWPEENSDWCCKFPFFPCNTLRLALLIQNNRCFTVSKKVTIHVHAWTLEFYNRYKMYSCRIHMLWLSLFPRALLLVKYWLLFIPLTPKQLRDFIKKFHRSSVIREKSSSYLEWERCL